MKNTGKKDHLKKTQKDYSLAFKLELVNEIEKGYLTYKEAQKKHGIQGRSTVLTWLRKHGILDWKSKVPMKDKKPPRTYISELEKKIKRLEAEKEILNRTIDIADENLRNRDQKKVFTLVARSFQGARGKKGRSIELVCSTLGYTRQYFYKKEIVKSREGSKKEIVKDLVDSERKILPKIGTRKLHHLIKDKLETAQIKFGRDKLFSLLKEYGLLITPSRRYMQTTMSKHWLRKWPNIIKDKIPVEPDQIWVSDITYIKTAEGNCYLNMITDKFSRKIVGYAVDDNMETESMIMALKMATKQKVNKEINTIHHSDRGLQYCSKEYVELTRKNNISLSMTENSDPYENALAERMNRTIKEEFGMNRKLATKKQVYDLVKESIDLYNNKRPHLSLKMLTPEDVYKNKKSRQPEAIGII